MPFYADLHLHSKYSRATSRDADLEHMAIWACKKGVTVLGTGDFTHPAWFGELQEKLVPAEPGLFRLRDDLQREVDRNVPAPLRGQTRFLLQVEISTIYKSGERTRKVHHLIYVPGFDAAERLIAALSRIGNLRSDGRPILGLDSRDLLEITLDSGPDSYLVPAHIWTPWFAALGSKSGFDSIDACYRDLTPEIFALETGLSSDPPMNWRLSQLDAYTLVSNSDAHSPPKIGREACVFDCDLSYYAIRDALRTREGYQGTVEFFPEEGKYHLDGHRRCGVRLEPGETRQTDGRCPECGRPLTVGVMNRVDCLADREDGYRPESAPPYRSLVPLAEVISELRGVGEKSKKVQRAYEEMLARVGSELFVLESVPLEDLAREASPPVVEAVRRMREGRVICDAGYDGEYGRIRLFADEERAQGQCVSLLFDVRDLAPGVVCEDAPPDRLTVEQSPPMRATGGGIKEAKRLAASETGTSPQDVAGSQNSGQAGLPGGDSSVLAGLDPEQRAAACHIAGPLLIVAGPGTGKTRTLTHRIAHLVTDCGESPEGILAITFSRRAVEEIRERLAKLLPRAEGRVLVSTFHALGLTLLREQSTRFGLPDRLQVADEERCRTLLAEALGLRTREASRLLKRISRFRRAGGRPDDSPELSGQVQRYLAALRGEGLLDFDDLIVLPAEALSADDRLRAEYRRRWKWVVIDEFQDIDHAQYRLVRQLTDADSRICAIGDPDQSIYGFRGADPRLFARFHEDFPAATTVQLRRNYRSSPNIVQAALQAIAPATQVADRNLSAQTDANDLIQFHAAASERGEAEFVVHSIERLIGGSTFFSFDSGRVADHESAGLSFADFAVLVRTDAQADVLAEAFERSGIPFQRNSHTQLADLPVFQDVLRQCRAQLVAAEQAGQSVAAVELVKRAVDRIWSEKPEAADMLPVLVGAAERANLAAGPFLDQLALGIDSDLWDPRAARVSLMTLHAAKGLEFPVVFLTGCEDGLLPLRFGGQPAEDQDEERRLFFVGLTRARRRLYLTHAARRMRHGKVSESAPSPFLREIRQELLERNEVSGRRPLKRSSETQLQLF